MFTENCKAVNRESLATASTAKALLRSKNWSYRRAANVLGVTYQHLCLVLNGHRVGTRLIPKIMAIGESPRRYRVRLAERSRGRAGK